MKIIRIIALILFSFSSSAFADSSNDFENKTIGLKLSKPSDWQFMTAKEYFENLKRVEMDDKKFQELIVKYASAPVVLIAKYPEPLDDLNPSFKINIKPIGQLQNSSAKETLEMMIPSIKNIFKDSKIDQEPINTEVAGLKGAYARFKYSAPLDGKTIPAIAEIWIIPNGDYFFMIGSSFRQDEKNGSHAEIKEILDSIVIE